MGHFLNVITPRDPDEAKPSVDLVLDTGISGVIVDGTLPVGERRGQSRESSSSDRAGPDAFRRHGPMGCQCAVSDQFRSYQSSPG